MRVEGRILGFRVLPLFIMIILCSETANNPAEVARICRENPLDEVYPLPWIDSNQKLLENLKVNRGKPNRMFPCSPNKKEEKSESISFQKNLPDDAFGTMADAVRSGTPVLNEIMKIPCSSGFYERILTKHWQSGAVVIMNIARLDEMFPFEPISAKVYAMTSVPVLMRNTDQFQKLTECTEKEVPVMAATDFTPKIVTFMSFYKLFSGKDFVFSVKSSNFISHQSMIWRYNKAYKRGL